MKRHELLQLAKLRKLKNITERSGRKYLIMRLSPARPYKKSPLHDRINMRAYILKEGLVDFLYRYNKMNAFAYPTQRQAILNNSPVKLSFIVYNNL